MSDHRQTLRRLAVRDDWYLQHVLPDGPANLEISQLDARRHALVRIGALVVLDAPPPSFEADIATALRAGATPTPDEIVGTLVVVMPVAGSLGSRAVAPNVGLGIGYDLELALEILSGRPERYSARTDTT